METMIERVASALCVADDKDPETVRRMSALRAFSGHAEPEWPGYLLRARAVLEAMREPTAAMVAAGQLAAPDQVYYKSGALSRCVEPEFRSDWANVALHSYRAMIDASLSERATAPACSAEARPALSAGPAA